MDAVGRLAGAIGHDLNNILTALSINTQFLLASYADDDPKRQDAEEIQLSCERVGDLARRLLALRQKRNPANIPIQLDRLVRETAPALRAAAGPRVQLYLRLRAGDAHVLMEGDAVAGALMELVRNAAAAKSRGQIFIDTSVVRNRAIVSVRDNGPGFSVDAARCGVEPFFTTRPNARNAGVGLTSVYWIARQTGGSLQIAKRSRGAEVRLIFPVAKSVSWAKAA